MLKGKVLPVAELTVPQSEIMFNIMQKYYNNILWNNFIADLQKKRDVVLLCDENDAIYGFTTLSIFNYNQNIQLVFSGDTIIEKEYWADNDLQRVWLINAINYSELFTGKTYWLLLSKGYRTYRYLCLFFKEFYPCWDMETPHDLQGIIDTFAVEHFGSKYKNGIYAAGKDYLKEEYDYGNAAIRKDKNCEFFLAANPGYQSGDELVCLCELSLDNLSKVGRRTLGR